MPIEMRKFPAHGNFFDNEHLGVKADLWSVIVPTWLTLLLVREWPGDVCLCSYL